MSTSAVGSTKLAQEFYESLNAIQGATSYETMVPTIEKTQRTLMEILTSRAGSRDFDNALTTQFSFLDILLRKSWISKRDYSQIFERTLELGGHHRPSDIEEEIEEYQLFLKSKARELASL